MYITLSQAKAHLNIDYSYLDDDNYINDLIGLAESVVELHINRKLDDIVTLNNGVLPAPLSRAMLLFIGEHYKNREIVSFATKTTSLPFNYEYLLDFYQQY